MKRLGLATLILAAAATLACEKANSSNAPETTANPEPEPEPEPEDDPEPEDEPEPEPEPEPAPAADSDDEPVSKVAEPVVEKDGFAARDLHCELNHPTKHARRYIINGLANKDDILDACAPKGAAIQVEWEYVSGQALNASVTAENNKMAKCVSEAMAKVGAGVEARCSAVLLLGDLTAATAAYDAR